MDTKFFRKLDDDGNHQELTMTVDGRRITAELGDSVASVMLRLSEPYTRNTPVSGARRAPYCLMGVCFDCLAIVDGVASTQTCLVLAREGMRVERQQGRRIVEIDYKEAAMDGGRRENDAAPGLGKL